jgi:hypothetical protein
LILFAVAASKLLKEASLDFRSASQDADSKSGENAILLRALGERIKKAVSRLKLMASTAAQAAPTDSGNHWCVFALLTAS